MTLGTYLALLRVLAAPLGAECVRPVRLDDGSQEPCGWCPGCFNENDRRGQARDELEWYR